MIPTENEAVALWDTYQLPENKRLHVRLVAGVALFLADRLSRSRPGLTINKDLLQAAALLHDIDKAVPKLEGERHPDTAVRLLQDLGMEEVARTVKTHSLHCILDPAIAPKTWEEKILYLADKMVKFDIITVEKRFALWNAEHLPQQAQLELRDAFPLVKKLEKEILSIVSISPEDLPRRVKAGIAKVA